MRRYELTYLMSSELIEEEAKIFQDKIISLIGELDGALVKKGELIKKKVSLEAEEISQSYLTTLIFQIGPEKLETLERRIKDAGEIIRYTLLAKKVSGMGELREGFLRFRRKRMLPSRQIAQRKTEETKQKVELKEIEKKLDEILGE